MTNQKWYPMDITFQCDNCGQNLEVEEAGAGMTVDCPKCGKPVYVPTKSTKPPATAPRVPEAPLIRDRVTPRVPMPSPYADKVKELTQEAEDKRKLAEYMIEPGINEWKALRFAAQTLKVLAVLSIMAGPLYPLFLQWEVNRAASDMMGIPPVQAPSVSTLVPPGFLRQVWALTVLFALFFAGGLWVISDLILLFIRLEQNTTRTVSLLRERH